MTRERQGEGGKKKEIGKLKLRLVSFIVKNFKHETVVLCIYLKSCVRCKISFLVIYLGFLVFVMFKIRQTSCYLGKINLIQDIFSANKY